MSNKQDKLLIDTLVGNGNEIKGNISRDQLLNQLDELGKRWNSESNLRFKNGDAEMISLWWNIFIIAEKLFDPLSDDFITHIPTGTQGEKETINGKATESSEYDDNDSTESTDRENTVKNDNPDLSSVTDEQKRLSFQEKKLVESQAFFDAMFGTKEEKCNGVKDTYDPAKGLLSHYIPFVQKRRKVDIIRKMNGRNSVEEIDQGNIPDHDQEKAKQKRQFPTLIRIDSTVKDKEKSKSETSMGHLIKDPTSSAGFDETNEEVFADQFLYELSSEIISFAENNRKGKRDLSTLNYYQLFYTSGITSYIKMTPELPKFQHERQMLSVMKMPFVDYCMTEKCRSFAQIYFGDMKRYAEVVDSVDNKVDPSKPIPIPIPDVVGICYLKNKENRTVPKGTYADNKKRYCNHMKSALKKKAYF